MNRKIVIIACAAAVVLLYLVFRGPGGTKPGAVPEEQGRISARQAGGDTGEAAAMKEFFGAVFSGDVKAAAESSSGAGPAAELARLEGTPVWAWEPQPGSQADAGQHEAELRAILELESRIAAGSAGRAERAESLGRKTRLLEEKGEYVKNMLHTLGQEQKQGRDVSRDLESWRLRLYIIERKLDSYRSGRA